MLAEALVHPMLFSTPMVLAILEGRKTQTRRIVKLKSGSDKLSVFIGGYDKAPKMATFFKVGGNNTIVEDVKVKFNIGDVLWVRESWQPINHPELKFRYKADHLNPKSVTWKPSIFMPKKACRLFLEVTDIRAERLQDITKDDAIAEGIELVDDGSSYGYKLYGNHSIGDMLGRKAVTGTEIESYQTLWQKINGVESWNENSFVWVITFKIVECPQGFC